MTLYSNHQFNDQCLSSKSILCFLFSESTAVSISICSWHPHVQLCPWRMLGERTLRKEGAAVCWLSAGWRGGASSGSVLVACSLLASSLLAWPRDTSPPSWQAHHTPRLHTTLAGLQSPNTLYTCPPSASTHLVPKGVFPLASPDYSVQPICLSSG